MTSKDYSIEHTHTGIYAIMKTYAEKTIYYDKLTGSKRFYYCIMQ